MAFRVGSAALGTVDVEAANWLIALGEGLVKLGLDHSPDRLACERLMNGTMLVRDVQTGNGFVVVPLDAEGNEPAPPAESDSALAIGESEADHDLAPGLDATSEDDFQELETEDIAPPSQVLTLALDAIGNAHDVDATVAVAVVAGVRLTRSKGGSALLLEEGGLRFRYVVGDHERRLTGLRIPLGAGVAGYSVSHRTALIVNEAYSDPRFYRNVDKHTGHRTRSLLCAPIVARNQAFGCIETIDSHDPKGFSDDQLGDLMFLATACANRITALLTR